MWYGERKKSEYIRFVAVKHFERLCLELRRTRVNKILCMQRKMFHTTLISNFAEVRTLEFHSDSDERTAESVFRGCIHHL